MRLPVVTLTIACVLFAQAGVVSAQRGRAARGRTHIGQPVAGSTRPQPATRPTPLPVTGPRLPRTPAPRLFGPYGFGLWSYAGWAFVYEEPSIEIQSPQDPVNVNGGIGGLRLRIEPGSARVFVDGYYVGVADDFRGYFSHMNL